MSHEQRYIRAFRAVVQHAARMDLTPDVLQKRAKRALYLDNVGRPVDAMTRQQPSRRIERPSLLLRGEHVTLIGDTVTSEPAYIEELQS